MAHLAVRFNTFIEGILRVPPIFILDEIFKSGFTFPFSLWTSSTDGIDISSVVLTHNDPKILMGNSLNVSLLFTVFKFVVSFIGE